jgi:hypothetical protein
LGIGASEWDKDENPGSFATDSTRHGERRNVAAASVTIAIDPLWRATPEFFWFRMPGSELNNPEVSQLEIAA